MTKRNMQYLLLFVVLFTGCNTDLHTKQWAVETLKDQPQISIFDGYVNLSYVENRGMVFGLFQRHGSSLRYFLQLGLTLLATVSFIIVIWLNRRGSIFFLLPLFIVLSGALGNLFYRIRFGHVVDFIHFSFKGPFEFPYVFNVADILISTGMVLLLLQLILTRKKAEGEIINGKTVI
ncbi:signal peptidase II [candidate division KSB1 bacterium]